MMNFAGLTNAPVLKHLFRGARASTHIGDTQIAPRAEALPPPIGIDAMAKPTTTSRSAKFQQQVRDVLESRQHEKDRAINDAALFKTLETGDLVKFRKHLDVWQTKFSPAQPFVDNEIGVNTSLPYKATLIHGSGPHYLQSDRREFLVAMGRAGIDFDQQQVLSNGTTETPAQLAKRTGKREPLEIIEQYAKPRTGILVTRTVDMP